MSRIRVGQGYDVHRLVGGRPLVLAGVEIPSDVGLEGVSDADVVLHALGDALLGAAALGDLGDHFPPEDERWRDADSGDLLVEIVQLVRQAGYRLINCDLTLMAERPKIAPFRGQMRQRVAKLTGLDLSCVSLKATTTEGLGFVGRNEGMAALAICLVESDAGDG